MKLKNELELQRLINESHIIEVSGTRFEWWSLYPDPVGGEPWIALALSEDDLHLSEYQYDFKLEDLLGGEIDGETLMVSQEDIPAILYLRFYRLRSIDLEEFATTEPSHPEEKSVPFGSLE